MKIVKTLTVGAILLCCAPVAGADTAAELLEHYQNKTPLSEFPADLDLNQAAAVQTELVTRLAATLGPVVGYKAGLTNPAVQQQFGVEHPLRGVLLEKMLLPDGAELPADFGAVPMSEGDLVVRVGDAAINQARTLMEVLPTLDAVLPFIELPDVQFTKGVKLDAAAITAINAGARYGVIGEPIPLSASDEWRERLRNFQLVQPGTRVVARYSGLDPAGSVSISVSFRQALLDNR